VIPTPKAPNLKFELTHDAAVYNMKQLQKEGNSIKSVINNAAGTFISYGSEF
jgi:hypothetical protein